MDRVGKEMDRDPGFKRAFTGLAAGTDEFLEALKTLDAPLACPYVSEATWALYAAYQAIIVSCVSQLRMLRLGFSPNKFLDATKVKDFVKQVLPDRAEFIGQQGARAYEPILQELEGRLTVSLRADAEGHASSESTVKHAASISQAASTLMADVTAANTKIDVASSGPALADSIAASSSRQPAP